MWGQQHHHNRSRERGAIAQHNFVPEDLKVFRFHCYSLDRNNNLSKMSDDEDYKIESTDAGASATIPMEAGQIKKGG